MVWAKLDDGFSDHPAVWGLSDAGYRLHVSGIQYSCRLLTDGIIPASRVSSLVPSFKPRTLTELFKAGRWHQDGHSCATCAQPGPDSVVIHEFLNHNRSKAEVIADREAAAERQRKIRASRRDSRGTSAVTHGVSHTTLSTPDPPSFQEGVGGERCATCDGTGWTLNDKKVASACSACCPHLRAVQPIEESA